MPSVEAFARSAQTARRFSKARTRAAVDVTATPADHPAATPARKSSDADCEASGRSEGTESSAHSWNSAPAPAAAGNSLFGLSRLRRLQRSCGELASKSHMVSYQADSVRDNSRRNRPEPEAVCRIARRGERQGTRGTRSTLLSGLYVYEIVASATTISSATSTLVTVNDTGETTCSRQRASTGVE